MADSEMALFPDCSTVDFDPAGKWNYTPGLIATAMVELWKQTGEEKYYGYVKSYADKFIYENGQIAGYKKSDFNIDKINSGKFLFDLLKVTGDKKYEKAIFVLRDQLKDQPRTSEGGFWHKKRYTNQMWLDGLYMGAPFYARFAKEYEPEDFDDVINQFLIVHKHTYNEKAGLNYHGWDESREQKWADPETGCSPHFWGRAMGWYAMALVDVLDYIPEEHQGRAELLKILNQVASGIKKYQDKKTGLWYQVLNLPDREGNYLESSVSSMFVYAISKAVRMGYIGKDYGAVAQNGYNG
ncbi:MAG: glycoside hydrolase family 88 protein, partial [Prolixibacteraceae bacterium]|nr:glycoside hydrolase family 88 protein [Prolixibacteraceae bacterium]